jgi:hypothetical protein
MTTHQLCWSAGLLVAFAVVSVGGACEVPQPTSVLRLEDVCASAPGAPITADILDGIRTFLVSRVERTVYFKRSTEPIFYFESLGGLPYREGWALSDKCLPRFARSPIEVELLMKREDDVGVYDDAVCAHSIPETPGHWVQVSSVVRDPGSGELGLFLRVTHRACLPYGGRRYWAPIKVVNDRWTVSDLIDLGVIEF